MRNLAACIGWWTTWGTGGDKKADLRSGLHRLRAGGVRGCERGKGTPGKGIALRRMIEDASHDAQNGGYFETYDRDWKLGCEQRLSEVDMDEKKSMNTHLHLLEAYANLLRLWNDDGLRKRLRSCFAFFWTTSSIRRRTISGCFSTKRGTTARTGFPLA